MPGECRGHSVAADSVDLSPERCLCQHHAEHCRQQAENQDRHRDAQSTALPEDREPGVVLVGNIHVLAAGIGQREPMDGRQHAERHNQRVELEIANKKSDEGPQAKRHRKHCGNGKGRPDLVVKIQHHNRRKRHHRSDGQIEIAADHHEGHS
jgi:hypothetical protein